MSPAGEQAAAPYGRLRPHPTGGGGVSGRALPATLRPTAARAATQLCGAAASRRCCYPIVDSSRTARDRESRDRLFLLAATCPAASRATTTTASSLRTPRRASGAHARVALPGALPRRDPRTPRRRSARDTHARRHARRPEPRVGAVRRGRPAAASHMSAHVVAAPRTTYGRPGLVVAFSLLPAHAAEHDGAAIQRPPASTRILDQLQWSLVRSKPS